MNSESLPQNNAPLTAAEIAAQLDAEQQTRNQKPYSGFALGLIPALAVGLPMLFLGTLKVGNMLTARQQQKFVADLNSAPAINWNYDLTAAQQTATAEKKSMMISFYTDWCPACKSLDANVYNDPYIRSEAKNIVPVKINAEAQTDVAKRYNINSYPTIVWTDATGTEKYRQGGGSSVREFWDAMRRNQ